MGESASSAFIQLCILSKKCHSVACLVCKFTIGSASALPRVLIRIAHVATDPGNTPVFKRGYFAIGKDHGNVSCSLGLGAQQRCVVLQPFVNFKQLSRNWRVQNNIAMGELQLANFRADLDLSRPFFPFTRYLDGGLVQIGKVVGGALGRRRQSLRHAIHGKCQDANAIGHYQGIHPQMMLMPCGMALG